VPIDISLLPSQHEFATSKHKHTAFIGGLGSGKTYVGAWKCILRALAPNNLDATGYIGANSYKQLRQATLAMLFELLDESEIPYDYTKGDGELWIAGRTAPILCYSLDNYDTLRGIKLGFAWLDETARTKVEAWKVVAGRMRHPGADLTVDITTTPDGFNWLYDKFVEDLEEDDSLIGVRKLVHASSYENYHLPDEYLIDLESSYDDTMMEQELEGKFVNIFGGRCYRTFDRKQHMTETLPAIPGVPLDLMFDFNVDPMSAVVCQYHRRTRGPDEIHAVDEIVLPISDTPSVCAEFIRRYPKWKAGVRVYGDSAGNNGTAGKTDYGVIREELGTTYKNFMIDVPAANPLVIDRVNSVNALFRQRKSGRPDIVVGRLSKGKTKILAKDLDQVSFKEGSRDIDKVTNRKLTHSSDAFGYYVQKVAAIGRYSGPAAHTVTSRYRRSA